MLISACTTATVVPEDEVSGSQLTQVTRVQSEQVNDCPLTIMGENISLRIRVWFDRRVTNQGVRTSWGRCADSVNSERGHQRVNCVRIVWHWISLHVTVMWHCSEAPQGSSIMSSNSIISSHSNRLLFVLPIIFLCIISFVELFVLQKFIK